ncbi:hypothetical protein RchiOBHm_Chr4g0423751 [Rosa chinensis]|uniref:Uncharacterized protein n=1 Tax=Rosa chinensis TaxID=74649 RepID=A0A2P6QYW7_ROSCH|nr:hypothetical protein RchiOBHm_Chr4g0423751 [Rosa chinensis]
MIARNLLLASLNSDDVFSCLFIPALSSEAKQHLHEEYQYQCHNLKFALTFLCISAVPLQKIYLAKVRIRFPWSS